MLLTGFLNMQDELDKIYGAKEVGHSKGERVFNEGFWKALKGLGNWVGLGDAIDRWMSQGYEDKYHYSKVLDELEKKLTQKAVTEPHDYTAHLNKIAEFQNALYNVNGTMARKFATMADNLTKKLESTMKNDSLRDSAKSVLYQQGVSQIAKAREKAASGDVYTTSDMKNLIKDVENTISSFDSNNI